jgi:hypothetical protein
MRKPLAVQASRKRMLLPAGRIQPIHKTVYAAVVSATLRCFCGSCARLYMYILVLYAGVGVYVATPHHWMAPGWVWQQPMAPAGAVVVHSAGMCVLRPSLPHSHELTLRTALTVCLTCAQPESGGHVLPCRVCCGSLMFVICGRHVRSASVVHWT